MFPSRKKAFKTDDTGFVLVFFAVALPSLIGFLFLAIDTITLYSYDTELAGIADAAALAAANQLDRSDTAIDRARNAGDALNSSLLSKSTLRRSFSLKYRFAEQKEDLQNSKSFTLIGAQAAQAKYVEVTSSGQNSRSILGSMLGFRIPDIKRRSIARVRYLACDITPIAFCHRDAAEFARGLTPGYQYLLRLDGRLSTGSLAVLRPPGVSSLSQDLVNLASSNPNFCHADDVSTSDAIAGSEFEAAINVRFDRYFAVDKLVSPDLAIYPPAPNVLQGRQFINCNSSPAKGSSNPPYTLPRDSAFSVIGPNSLFDAGRGDWKIRPPVGGTMTRARTALAEYMFWNHSNKSPIMVGRLQSSPTRYDLYLTELGISRGEEVAPLNLRDPNRATQTRPTGAPGFGRVADHVFPTCYRGYDAFSSARRRIFFLSILDCEYASTFTAERLSKVVGKFFLTEPVNKQEMLLEFVDFMRPRVDGDKLRKIVELVLTD